MAVSVTAAGGTGRFRADVQGIPLALARTRAKLPRIAFHDLRHYFISYAVMSGIDYMTIAKWVGHRDGGILIGKVYGHLADDHA